jgi:environmental stress-induced protein Ves
MADVSSGAVRLIRYVDHRLVPWRNGGGVTREIDVAPDARGALGYGWRLSRATVAAPGPFSDFPRSDRTLLMLSGQALTLTVAGVKHRLLPREWLAFPGDAATTGEPDGGPVEDLNIICDRGLVSHRLILAQAGSGFAGEPGETLLLVALEACSVRAAGGPEALSEALLATVAEGDTVRLDGAGRLELVSGAAALIRLWPAGEPRNAPERNCEAQSSVG